MTFSVKSSVGKLQSLSKALVSTSTSPMGPSSSTRVPKGWSELIGCETMNNSSCTARRFTYVTLDASDEEFVRILFGVLDEIRRRLFSGNGDEGNALVGGLEPHDLGTLDRTTRFVSPITLPLTALSFLLLLSGCRRWAQKPKGSGEELAGHALDNCDDMSGKLGLHFVCNPAHIMSDKKKDDVEVEGQGLMLFEDEEYVTRVAALILCRS